MIAPPADVQPHAVQPQPAMLQGNAMRALGYARQAQAPRPNNPWATPAGLQQAQQRRAAMYPQNPGPAATMPQPRPAMAAEQPMPVNPGVLRPRY